MSIPRQLVPSDKPRPPGQIQLDYTTQVMSPQIFTLLATLCGKAKGFWCREFEELYRAYKGWRVIWRIYRDGWKRGTILDTMKQDLQPEWRWLFHNFAVLPSFRRAFLAKTASLEVNANFISGAWVDIDPKSLPSLREMSEPRFFSSDLGQEFTPASWIASGAGMLFKLREAAYIPPDSNFMRSIGLSAFSSFPSSSAPLLPLAGSANLSSAHSSNIVADKTSSKNTVPTATRAGHRHSKENDDTALDHTGSAAASALTTLTTRTRRLHSVR